MKKTTLGLALACVAATSFAGQAGAQSGAKPRAATPAPAAAPAQPPLPTGPAIPGMCVLNNDGVVFGSAVGKFVVQRLNQLKAQSDSELTAEETTLRNDAQALEGQKATLPPDQFEQRGSAINLRANALQRKAQQREAEIQQTEKKAVGRIGQEADPIVRQVFAQHNCTILINAGAVFFAAPSLDLTPAVIQGLDAKITQFQFDREHIEQPAAQPGR